MIARSFFWLLAVCGLMAMEGNASANDAVTYQIDVAHSGRATLDGFTGRLKHLWTRDLGGAISYPLIADGLVFVTVAAGSSSVLYALDPRKGDSVWQLAIPGPYPVSSAAYDAGQIFVVNESGLLQALDAASGALRWSKQLTYQWDFHWPPVATNGTVFITGNGDAASLYALSEKGGHFVWRDYKFPMGEPVAYGKMVAVTGQCFHYYGFAAKTGEWLWTWESATPAGDGDVPVFYDGKVFARDYCAGLFKNRILNAKTGGLEGSFKADQTPSFFTMNGSDYIVALSKGTLRATPVEKHAKPLWTFRGDRQFSAAPLIVNNYVVEGSQSGRLYILDETDGERVATYSLGGAIGTPQLPLTGPAAGDGLVVVPAGTQLTAFAPKQ